MKDAMIKHRDSNLELFRILAMLSIIAHHYVVNSGVWNEIQAVEPTTYSLFYYIFGMWGKTGINCFVLITGWFMCSSRISLRKFLKLLLEIEFYKIVIGGVFLLTGKDSFSSEWLLGLLPVRNIKTGFVAAFLVFFPFNSILEYPGQEYDAEATFVVNSPAFLSVYRFEHDSGIQRINELRFVVLCPLCILLVHAAI